MRATLRFLKEFAPFLLTVLAIILTALGIYGSLKWYYANRTFAKDCIASHSEETTCSGMMDSGNGSTMFYSYPCSYSVCDQYQCFKRASKHEPWQVIDCP